MRINLTPSLDFDDVNIIPKSSELESRSQVNLNVSYVTKHSKVMFSGVPIIVSNMAAVGQIPIAKVLYSHKIWVALHKFYNWEVLNEFLKESKSFRTFISTGISDNDLEMLKYLGPSSVCIDAANAYMYKFLDFVKKVRDVLPKSIIMAGNVCTPEGVENIIKAGADISKCGISQGNFCETKNKTGVGRKQFTVAMECGQAANELNALCCSDGGCKTPADICKALGAGSHLVMSGSLFSGYEEATESEWKEEDGKKQMLMYGMSSKYANDKFFGGLADYRTSEGRKEWIDSKGTIDSIVQQIKGGLASCCTYTNTKNLENLYKNCEFET